MISAVKKYPDGGDIAITALGNAVEKYLCDNTDATFTWIATQTIPQPLPIPDPTTKFSVKFTPMQSFLCPKPKDFDTFIKKLALYLNGIVMTAPSTFSVSPLKSGIGTFTAEQLGSFSDSKDGEKALKEAYEKIAKGVLDGWKSYFLTATSGTDTAGSIVYTGAGTLVGVK